MHYIALSLNIAFIVNNVTTDLTMAYEANLVDSQSDRYLILTSGLSVVVIAILVIVIIVMVIVLKGIKPK